MQLPEIVAAGIYHSNIFAKNIAVSKNRITSMVEIELPVESGGISYIDDQAHPIRPNMIICAKPGQLRHTKFPYQCYYVHMILREGLLYDILLHAPDCFETKQAEHYKALFLEIIKLYNTLNERDEILLQSKILALVHLISEDSAASERNAFRNNNHFVIEQALRYIKENLTENLKLEEIAKQIHLSPIYFHNAFKAATGKTLRDYVEEQRIKKAINLLLTTNDSLTKIAFECGFSSQSYFSFVFKRRMKMTPREYVKALNQNYEI